VAPFKVGAFCVISIFVVFFFVFMVRSDNTYTYKMEADKVLYIHSNSEQNRLPDFAKMDSLSIPDFVAIASADDPSTQPKLR